MQIHDRTGVVLAMGLTLGLLAGGCPSDDDEPVPPRPSADAGMEVASGDAQVATADVAAEEASTNGDDASPVKAPTIPPHVPDDGGPEDAGATPVEDAATPASIDPLPVSTFVFYRWVKNAAGKTVAHLMSRDVESGQERLIFDLDDRATTLASGAGDRISISPDRRWIAFAGDFRATQADLHLVGRTSFIWKVSADGRQLVRLTAPISDYRSTCDAGCPSDMFCEAPWGRCTWDFWSDNYEHPIWSADGQTIYAHRSLTACDNVGCQKLDTFHFPMLVVSDWVALPNRPGSVGMRLPDPATGACNTFKPAVSPDGTRLAASFDYCGRGSSGGVVVADANGANPVFIGTSTCSHLEWRPDGQALYCSRKNGLYLVSVAERTVTGILAFTGADINKFSVSRDGRWMVMNLAIPVPPGRHEQHIYVADIQATPLAPNIPFRPVIMDGASIWPAF